MNDNPLSIDSVKMCRRCPTLSADHVPSEGNPNAKLLVVGQSPGEQEVKYGRPFIGPSGDVLDYLLDEIGLAREDVYIANALKCHPPGNRKGHPEEIETCFGAWLNREIKQVDPKVVLLLGHDAHNAVVQNRHPFKHGVIWKSTKRNYVDAWHPAYILRLGPDGLPDYLMTIGTAITTALEMEVEDE